MAFDPEKAATHAVDNALPGSTGKCARYVRYALEAGGLDTSGAPVSAKDYGAWLETRGFCAVPDLNYLATKGDVVVLQAYKGGSAHGHIAIYSGSNWVSDFVQRDLWGGPGYRKAQPAKQVYRYVPPQAAIPSAWIHTVA
jgi:type VI secretion system secreted protein VgrG